MRSIIHILIGAFAIMNTTAQNLVINGSFEDSVHCPGIINGSLIENAVGWVTLRASPDYFNSCADDSIGLFDVPLNGFGYQYASSGNAYAGFYSYGNPDGGSENYREFIGTHLIQPLVIGDTYYVTFKISWTTNGSNFLLKWATNNLGALFSTQQLFSSTVDPLYNHAQVYTSIVISDSLNWTEISGSFLADSSYDYVMFGNFFDAQHTTAISYGSASLGAYYYIDDICVSATNNNCDVWNSVSNTKIQEGVKLFPNPVDDKLFVELTQIQGTRLEIFDSKGVVVIQKKEDEIHSQNEFDMGELKNGLYVCCIFSGTRSIFKSFIIHH